MNRKLILKMAFDRGHLLNLKNPIYKTWVEKFIIDETKGDTGRIGDITSNVLLSNKILRAKVISKGNFILAGVEESIFLYQNYKINVKSLKKDGSRVKKGETVMLLRGNQKDLLRIERSALDLLGRMSGIATLTKEIQKLTKIPIAPTRKTQWRYLDKKAVYLAGGLTHRLALWESIIIKDNHLLALYKDGIKNPIQEALRRAWDKKSNFIEIEVETTKQAVMAAKTYKELQKNNNMKPCLIMFDNMAPKKIMKTIKDLKKRKLYKHILIEVSGGITPDNIKKYKGIDVISLGYLTHSSKAADFKQYFF